MFYCGENGVSCFHLKIQLLPAATLPILVCPSELQCFFNTSLPTVYFNDCPVIQKGERLEYGETKLITK